MLLHIIHVTIISLIHQNVLTSRRTIRKFEKKNLLNQSSVINSGRQAPNLKKIFFKSKVLVQQFQICGEPPYPPPPPPVVKNATCKGGRRNNIKKWTFKIYCSNELQIILFNILGSFFNRWEKLYWPDKPAQRPRKSPQTTKKEQKS